ncbi:hypothetical protein GCM10025872_28830 [Barrientosiimonas endolithica]|uniref:Uncharacterized protein n=1 Tax=Barrientosiimonas endolithica TaxID=1535208 RepID=A0ABM8HE16_9MICO|nr:hypothetical protein GCM10025872_28830 [Barrientosiimonas endolithica]
MREEVEVLEDEPDLRALPSHLALGQLVQVVAGAAVADELAVDPDQPAVDLLQVIDRAQQGRLARAGGSDDGGDAAVRDGERHVVQHQVGPESLGDGVDLDERLAVLGLGGLGGSRGLGGHRICPVRAVWAPARHSAAWERRRCSGVGACASRELPRA